MSLKTVSIIGGDLRQLTLAGLLVKAGYDVSLYGWDCEMSRDFKMCKSVAAAAEADVLIFPMPMCIGTKVNAPFCDEEIEIDALLSNISWKTIVLGGKIPLETAERLNRRKIIFADYLKREELAIKNAVATAEGAVEIAMHEIPITIHSSKCLVTGYGRIAKILARMLKNMGAEVCVAARRIEVRAEAEADGFRAVDTKNIKNICKEYEIIFNTVPALLFDKETLRYIDKKALLIDLASKPGGVDFESAGKENVNVIWALSLPGKVAPVTSGKIIYETVMNIFNELEV